MLIYSTTLNTEPTPPMQLSPSSHLKHNINLNIDLEIVDL